MQSETLLQLALISASIQVVIQVLGVAKALLEWLTVRQKTKGSDRRKRSKPKSKRRK